MVSINPNINIKTDVTTNIQNANQNSGVSENWLNGDEFYSPKEMSVQESSQFALNLADTIDGMDTSNSVGHNVGTVEDTKASIEEDFKILQQYDELYAQLLKNEEAVEKEAAAFEYPDLKQVKTSAQANQILAQVKEQIERIQTLIDSAEAAIKVLENEKKTAENQLNMRNAEAERTEQEIHSLELQMKQNEESASREIEKYQADSDKRIEQYIIEYQQKGLEEQGIDLQEYLAGKMASFSMPASVEALSSTNKQLASQIDVKKEQLGLINKSIEILGKKINDIDSKLGVQKQKLENYNANKEYAVKFKDVTTKLRDALKRAEDRARKKKKHGLKKFLNPTRIISSVFAIAGIAAGILVHPGFFGLCFISLAGIAGEGSSDSGEGADGQYSVAGGFTSARDSGEYTADKAAKEMESVEKPPKIDASGIDNESEQATDKVQSQILNSVVGNVPGLDKIGTPYKEVKITDNMLNMPYETALANAVAAGGAEIDRFIANACAAGGPLENISDAMKSELKQKLLEQLQKEFKENWAEAQKNEEQEE